MRAPPRERKVTKSVNLPPRLWDFVREVGAGEYSAGIRYILETVYEQERSDGRVPAEGSELRP